MIHVDLSAMANEIAGMPLPRVAAVVLVYYLITLGGLLLIIYMSPQSAAYLPVGGLDKLQPQMLPLFGGGGGGIVGADAAAATMPAVADIPGRAVALFASLLGALVFVWPIAWVYRRTHGNKQTDSLVETLILLPIVVTTVISIVQNSITLAFSLFGLVAAVRFRNNLKNPADAVFVFAALTVGMASGVSEIGIAGAGSLVFCATVLGLHLLRTVDA
jgi:hypothetical protein